MSEAWKKIEGETPLDDLLGLKLRVSNPTRAIVGEFEARNIQKVEEKYFARRLTWRKAPFDLPWLKRLHREMLGDVWDWAGGFRTTNKSIGVPKEQIQEQLLQLLDDLQSWSGMEIDWLEQAVRLHHRAVQVHPFENGNGRWARMVSNIWLRLNGQKIVAWPVTLDPKSPIRNDYIAAVQAADDMDYGPLLELHRKYQES